MWSRAEGNCEIEWGKAEYVKMNDITQRDCLSPLLFKSVWMKYTKYTRDEHIEP